MRLADLFAGPPRRPWGLKWRSSASFITAVIGVGITTDFLVDSAIIPVVPFQLEHLGYDADSASALTGWLLFAYSAGLVLSTLPIAAFAEKVSSRRTPLLIGLLSLLAAQIVFMEAPNYALMAVARVLQGISSSMVWVVGLALICDSTPEHNVGRQIGFAMTGLSIGIMAGAPAGGFLYARFGFRGPFVFGEICTLFDLLLRLLVIERDVAVKWGYDPATGQDVSVVADVEASRADQTVALGDSKPNTSTPDPCAAAANHLEGPRARKPLPVLSVIRILGQSSRTVVALTMSLVTGIVVSMQDPTLPLHLQAVWGYTSDKVGLVYMASLIPTLISSPLAGFFADCFGAEYVTPIFLLFTIPWWIVLVLDKSIVLFIVSLALQSFFFSGINPPVTAEFATVSRKMPGVGYAHVYGAYNIAYGVGTAVGPIVGGQVYSLVKNGWTALCYMTAALLAACIVLAVCFTGDRPLLSRVLRRSRPSLGVMPTIEKPLNERATTDVSAVPSS